MIHSILQIIGIQLLFLIVYDLFLKQETFFSLNRIYLLLTPVLGIVLPFVSIGFIQQNFPQEFIFQLPAILVGGEISEINPNPQTLFLPSLLILWILGMFIAAVIFIYKLYKIFKLKSVGKTEKFLGFKLIAIPGTSTAFSFWDTIFLGANVSEENKTNIIAHEKIHIGQKHSADLLFYEMLRIVLWFNPAVYLFQNRIATLHEFIADEKVALQKDKRKYYQNLLSEVFQTDKISFINTFFNQSLIKKRIIMLQKPKSTKTAQFKYLLLLPLICAMLIYSSCSDTEKQKEFENTAIPVAEKNVAVPFAAIEKVPVYPGCTEADNEAMKKCMSMNISQFVNENFNTRLGKELGLTGKQRIVVQFKIDKTGNIVDVRARAPKPELEAEAVRVVKMLPQMHPGEQKGEKVGVLYSLPIIFDVQ